MADKPNLGEIAIEGKTELKNTLPTKETIEQEKWSETF
ncbi:thymosin beta-10-like [Sturnira hondurensis]|nr:thymosin beta-10-like [Sturnira hondurensis]